MSQITVILGPEQRRVWNDEQKRQLVAAIAAPGANASSLLRPRHAPAAAQTGCASWARISPRCLRSCRAMLKAWPAFTAFLDDGRICLTKCGGTRAQGHSSGQKIVALRRLRPRPAAHGPHAEPDPQPSPNAYQRSCAFVGAARSSHFVHTDTSVEKFSCQLYSDWRKSRSLFVCFSNEKMARISLSF